MIESAGQTNGAEEPLSPAESVRLAECLAELTQAGLPLASGLRAAAAEAIPARLAAQLREMARQIEAGRGIEEILASGQRPLSVQLSGVVRAGLRSGKLGHVLSEFLNARNASHDLWRRVRLALAYPALVMTLR